MNLTELRQNLAPTQTLVELVLETGNREHAHEVLGLIQEQILTEDNARVDSPDVKAYKDLASQLKAHVYRMLPTRAVPKVFAEDIAHILNQDISDIIRDIGSYLDRFKIESDFARQQKTLVTNLLANKQRLTKESIVTDDGKKVAATVGNWIKYFYRKVGGDQSASRIKIAEFFSKDGNITRLDDEELRKVKNLITIQEYLRAPTKELMQSLIAFTVRLGEGVTGYYENGDVDILTDLNKFNPSEKKGDGELELEASSNIEKKQEPKRIQRTELKPVSSSDKPKEMPNPLDNHDVVQGANKLEKISRPVTADTVKEVKPKVEEEQIFKKKAQVNQVQDNSTKSQVIDRKSVEKSTSMPQRPKGMNLPPELAGQVATQNTSRVARAGARMAQLKDIKASQPIQKKEQQNVQNISSLKPSQKEVERKDDSRTHEVQGNSVQKRIKENISQDKADNSGQKNEVQAKQDQKGVQKQVDQQVDITPKQDDLHKKVSQVYSDSEDVQLAIQKRVEQIKSQTAGSSAQVIDRLVSCFTKPDTYSAIALLHICAQENLWDVAFAHPEIHMYIAKFNDEKSIGDITNKAIKVQVLIRALLEAVVGFSQNESARVAAQLVDSMDEAGTTEFMTIVYFDIESEKFVWNQDL